MIRKTADKIVSLLQLNSIIKNDDREIYQYGIEIIISTLINIFIDIAIGLLFNELISAIIFFILFALIRSSSGGYHADTYLKCNSIFALNLSIVLLWIKYATVFYDLSVHLAFIFIYFAVIIKFAPMENENKPLDKLQKIKSKKLCLIYGTILTITTLILWYGFSLIKYAELIALVLFSVTIAIVIPILRNGGEINEESNSQSNSKSW